MASKCFLWSDEQRDHLSGLRLTPGTAEHSLLCSAKNSAEQQSSVSDYTSDATLTDVRIVCSVCQEELLNRQHQIQHYSADYHANNMRRALSGLPPIKDTEFQLAIENEEFGSSDSESEDFSISDSEEEDEENQPSPTLARSPRLFYTNDKDEVISIFRALVLHAKQVPCSEEELCLGAQRLPRRLKWTILMESGGHFAGAVFSGEEVLVHKTFHSYTVRAGQGGSQGARDNKSATSHPRSAGASLRRYNEASHYSHIMNILNSWRGHIQESHLIFLRAGRRSNHAIFNTSAGPAIVEKTDTRIRSVPFPTRRPTFKEVKRVHKLLAEVKVHGSSQHFRDTCFSSDLRSLLKSEETNEQIIDEEFQEQVNNLQLNEENETVTNDENLNEITSAENNEVIDEIKKESSKCKKKKKRKNRQVISKITVPTITNEDLMTRFDEDLLHNELYTACRTGDLDTLISLHQLSDPNATNATCNNIKNNVAECIERNRGKYHLLSLRMGELQKSALHLATENEHKNLVSWLLESGEGDPSTLDANNKLPYNYCTNKQMKTLYRKFRGCHPHMYDYSRSGIPEAITDDDQKARKAALKAKKEAKREKQEAIECQQLTEREKRALAAERRILKTVDETVPRPVFMRCRKCSCDISGLVPYSYYDFKFCSMDCLKEHKKANS